METPRVAPRAPAKNITFANDSNRFQQIDSIRKGPVGVQIKHVINLLLETRQTITPELINEACYLDVNANKAIFESLVKNPKVNFDGKHFSYKSKHDLKDKNQLLSLIREFSEGIPVIDLKDSYPTVMEDLQVDDELKLFFKRIELPRNMLDIEKDFQKNGIKPATDTAKRRVIAQSQGIQAKSMHKEKKNEIRKRTKLTNSHLPELFKCMKS